MLGADINLLWNNAVHRAVGKDHYEWADHGKLVLNRYRDGQDDKNSNSVQHNEKRQLPDSHFGKLATIFILISSDSKGDNQSREFYDPKKQKFPDYGSCILIF